MKTLIFFVSVFLISYTASSQKKIEQKVAKDTLYFNLDKNYLILGEVFEDEYTILGSKNSSEGIAFRIEKSIYNLKPKTILNFEEYVSRLDKLTSAERVKSKENKIFSTFEYNAIIFIDKTEEATRYMLMRPSLYTID